MTLEPISNTTMTRCQNCGKWTNYAGDEWHITRMRRLEKLEPSSYELCALDRAISMLRNLAKDRETPDNPYGGLLFTEDADLLESLKKRIAEGDKQ